MRGRKARKSKAAATVSVEEVNIHQEPECKHFAIPDHRTKDDILQCKAVFDGLRDKLHSHFVIRNFNSRRSGSAFDGARSNN